MSEEKMQWQPIETAPKDKQILIWSPMYRVCHVEWCNARWMIVHDSGDPYYQVIPDDATHWQPSPEPPTQ
jgi:hypothetical protein